MVQTLEGDKGTAVVDGDDRLYRYHLTRDLGEGEGRGAFIMLNPSTANHHCDDDTVVTCKGLARNEGWRVLEVGNLYARYATNPADLRNVENPEGLPHNDEYLRQIATRCSTVVAAWGVQGNKLGSVEFRTRANHVLRLIWEAMESARPDPVIHRLGPLTTVRHPSHPSRKSNDERVLVRWDGTPPQIQIRAAGN